MAVKRLGREDDHSLPFKAEAKNAWSYTSTPPMRLHDVVLRAQDKFTFTFMTFVDDGQHWAWFSAFRFGSYQPNIIYTLHEDETELCGCHPHKIGSN
jgi:hypothetical protein